MRQRNPEFELGRRPVLDSADLTRRSSPRRVQTRCIAAGGDGEKILPQVTKGRRPKETRGYDSRNNKTAPNSSLGAERTKS